MSRKIFREGKKMSKIVENKFSEKSCLSVSELARNKFSNIEKWINSDEAKLMGLRDVELEEEIRGRELLRLLLQSNIDGRGTGDAGPAIQVSDNISLIEAILYPHKRLHTRNFETIYGKIYVRRFGYGKDKKVSIHPLDEILELPVRTYSYEIQRRLVKKVIQGPFDEAIDALYEATGVKIPKRSAEEILIDASHDFNNFYSQRQGAVKDSEVSILIGSVDCKGIPMVKSELSIPKVRRKKGEKAQKKKMATVAAVFTQNPYIRTPEDVIKSIFDSEKESNKKQDKHSRPENKRVWASLTAGKDAFISDVNEEMKRRDPQNMKQHVVVTDGERALQRRVAYFIKNIILILDFLHVLEKLWVVGHALYGEESSEAEVFVKERALRILRGKVSQVVKGLRQIVTKRNLKGTKRDNLLDIANYFYRNRFRMCYDEYLSKGLPIASGAVEGACKNLIKDRMERSGMRWTVRTAEAMVKMRATYLSGDFEEYWDYHVSQEQARLYPKNRWKPGVLK